MINYVQMGNSKQASPRTTQGRWSHHSGPHDDDIVPLSAGPRDDIGPGQGQSQDPFIHDQYFGVASSGLEDEPGPSGYIYPAPSPNERGHFVR